MIGFFLQIFQTLDTNNDGCLSFSEFVHGLNVTANGSRWPWWRSWLQWRWRRWWLWCWQRWWSSLRLCTSWWILLPNSAAQSIMILTWSVDNHDWYCWHWRITCSGRTSCDGLLSSTMPVGTGYWSSRRLTIMFMMFTFTMVITMFTMIIVMNFFRFCWSCNQYRGHFLGRKLAYPGPFSNGSLTPPPPSHPCMYLGSTPCATLINSVAMLQNHWLLSLTPTYPP